MAEVKNCAAFGASRRLRQLPCLRYQHKTADARPLQQPEGPLRVLTDSLRTKYGLDWRNGVVQDRRFEYFRGKDFAAYFKQHPEKFDSWIPDKSGQCG